MKLDIRWQQRFQNYQRAFGLLSEALRDGVNSLSALEQEGALQRFEYSLELAWKVMKDYLEADGVVISPLTPKNVIKKAFAASIIKDGQLWIDMLLSRNLMSHTYDFSEFTSIIKEVESRYLSALAELEKFFAAKL